MIPIAGSAYTYSYATMGEFIAWIIGWDLVLEYALGAATVSIAWSQYLNNLLQQTVGWQIPYAVVSFSFPAFTRHRCAWHHKYSRCFYSSFTYGITWFVVQKVRRL
jgi:amino acid transporter